MVKAIEFVIVRFLFFLIIGIITACFIQFSIASSIILLIIVFFLLIVVYFLYRNSFQQKIHFGFITYLTIIALGIFVFNVHDPRNDKNHYSHLNAQFEDNHIYRLKVLEILKPSYNKQRFIVAIKSIDQYIVNGKILLTIDMDNGPPLIEVDEIISAYSDLKEINPPLNPGSFNYKAYLQQNGIYHQLNIHHKQILCIDESTSSIRGFAYRLRASINNKLRINNFEDDELAVINALLLGQRDDVSKELYQSFINSGGVHILAVSGLHIGIIMLMLQRLLSPLASIKHGKTISVVMILLLLWSYAFLAGLSPSICRAVTMFSALTLAQNLKRVTNTYNTLAISAFILLLFDPMYLFKIGFQLSYAAVIAIVSLYPLFNNLISTKWIVFNRIWQLISVSTAAQIGVLPLSLYYFNQFPGLFLLTNLAIVPILGIILGSGFILIILSLLNSLPTVIAQIYGSLISFLNNIVSWVASKEVFLFTDIPFNIADLIKTYTLIILILVLIYIHKRFRIYYGLIGLLILLTIVDFGEYKLLSKEEVVIFNANRQSCIGALKQKKLSIYFREGFDSINYANFIRDYQVHNKVQQTEYDTLKSIYNIYNKKLLVIDSMGIYNVKGMNPDYILLINSPKINLSRILDSLNPKLIIADASNYISYKRRWKATARHKKTPFYDTSEKGAYIFKKMEE